MIYLFNKILGALNVLDIGLISELCQAGHKNLSLKRRVLTKVNL